MKVIGISVMMPAAENIRGTSALPYHLLAGRDKSIEVILSGYNPSSICALITKKQLGNH